MGAEHSEEQSANAVSWTVPEEAEGMRLDRALARRLDLPRNRVQHLIRDHRVLIDGRRARVATPLRAGSRVQIELPASPPPHAVVPEPGPLPLLYEDDQLLVVDKPAGLAVHPGAGRPSGTLANRLIASYPELQEVGSSERPGIVHRLDIGTSGVLAVARTPQAYAELSRAFAERRVEKRYLAIAWDRPREDRGTITKPLGRDPRNRKRISIRPKGRAAITHYRMVAHEAGITLFELDIATGRTHQIRVHLKALGHPILGDPTYGEERWKNLQGKARLVTRSMGRPALHAWRLTLPHPVEKEPLTVVAPPPPDLVSLWCEATNRSWPVP